MSGERSDQTPTSADMRQLLMRAHSTIASLKQQLNAAHAPSAPVAVTGVGLRLPGGISSVDAFWDALQSGRIACADVPANRQFRAGATDGRTRYGSFLSDVESFDPEFFGIAAAEAERMDPQQRVSLMVASEAIVDAGIALSGVARRSVGVYFGVCGHDHYGVELNPSTEISAYSGAGASSSMVANRLSYLFDFRGPSIAVDTACSSSLVAAHLALQGLASGECELALVGGVNLILSEGVSRAHAAAGMLARDGRCKTFDASADGFGRGEGCVVLVLEPLQTARARRCHIYGLIHGSAVNQDGRSNGLTAPNLNAQRDVIRAALSNARTPAESIGMIEAHGTGTPLGDPIEVAALREVFDSGSGQPPCWLTAVKPNLGHLEGAAGVAGLLKALQCVERGVIPPLAGFNVPNPHLALEDSVLKLALTGTDWNVAERRAGVSSFGFGGTNAHLIVGNAEASDEAARAPADHPFRLSCSEQVLCLSARSRAGLLQHVEAVAHWLEQTARDDNLTHVTVRDVCATFALQRDAFEHRVAVIGSTLGELAHELRAFGSGQVSARAFDGIAKDERVPRVCGLVPGQGSQLTTELPALFELFDGLAERWNTAVETLERAGRLPTAHAGSPLETDCAQPLLGLYTQVTHELWSRWGVRPSILLGHSVGELIACGVAGALEPPMLWELLSGRGCVLQDNCEPGAMISVALGSQPLDELLRRFPELDLAADNGGGAVVLAGSSSEVSRLQAWAGAHGLKAKLLDVTRAFHSRLMDAAEPALRQLFADASFRTPRDRVVSALTGDVITERELVASHWLRHVREPVRFAQAIAKAALLSDVWLELGPGSTLCGLVGAELGSNAVCVPTQHRRAHAAEALLGALAQLFVSGVAIRWEEVFGATRCVPGMPTVGWALGQFPIRHLGASVDTPMPEELHLEFEQLPGTGLARLDGKCWLLASDDTQVWRDTLCACGVTCVSDASLLGGPADTLLFVAPAVNRSDELPLEACVELLHAAQTAFEAAHGAKRRLVIVVGAETATPRLLAEALWGVAASIRAEWSELELLVVEAEGRSREDVLNDLTSPVAVAVEAERVRWVNGVWAARRLKRRTRSGVLGWTPDPDATYLLSGGRGALGLKLAHWLVARGARSLVLAGRRPVSDEVNTAVERLQATGARVQCPTLDVADRGAVQEFFARAAANGVVVRGVFHLASAGEDKGFRNLQEGHLRASGAAKVSGAANLIDAGGADLDLFVATSSLAGVLGSAGQCAYSCANAALDAYVEHSCGAGRRLSCALGPVTDVGMYAALAQHQRERVAAMGFVAHPADEYFAAMALALAGDQRHVALATIRGSALADALPPRARELIAPLIANPAREQHTPIGAWDLNELCSETQPAGIMERLRSLARALLGGRDLKLPGDTGFVDLGFDSLLAVEFRNRLARAVGDRMALTATLIYDYPTLDALSAYLMEGLGLSKGEPSKAVAVQLTQVKPETHACADARAVAVVAMACRFPGGVRDVGAYWAMITRGANGVRPFPDDRWSSDYLGRAAELKDLRAATIDGPYEWAPEEFGIAPREASSIDPQQRLLVELTAEALEQAGIEVGSLDKRRVGVFVGIGVPDFAQLQLLEGDLDSVDGYFGSGTTLSAAAGRIAFCFGFQGPCLAVDTACSSSLVAVHLARKALLAGECDWAVVGGVNLLLSPAPFLNLSRAGMLAPDGRCKPFQKSADGFGRGEGCGVILLRRAPDAREGGNFIWSLISGSAVNQDGRTATLTAPNGPAQVAVIEQALAEAGRSPMDIDYVEAHGTGTALGDPMEAQALGAAYRSRGPAVGRELSIGSVKANIGHLEAGAGLAGLIKTVLAVHQAKLPPQPAGDAASEKVDWLKLGLRLQTELAAWPTASVRCAGVSSFGFVGTNAHVIVESAPLSVNETCVVREPGPALVTFCAPSRQALLRRRDAIAGLADLLPAETPVHDFLMSVRRSDPHGARHRMAGVITGCRELAPLLTGDVAEGGEKIGLFASAPEGALHPPRVAWLFSGQGTQSVGMGRMLADSYPQFREAVRECEGYLPLAQHGVFDALLDPTSVQDIEQTDICQPMIFVYQVALARLWMSFGLRPSYVLGHSVGEFAAAVIAGILDLKSALRLVVARGRLMAEATPDAAMLGLRCNGARAAELAATFDVDIAAYNSPSSTTVSGETKAIEALEHRCRDLGISTRRLRVSRAFHGRQMNGISAALGAELKQVEFAAATTPILRGMDGQVDADGVMSRGEYWVEQSLRAVNFEQGLRTLRNQSVTGFVEIGPQPALVGLAREVVGDAQTVYLASQRRQETSPVTLLRSVAQLYVAGADLSWQHLGPDEQAARVPFPLPGKPRVHKEYRPRAAHATASAGARVPEMVSAWPGVVHYGPGERWTSTLRLSARASDSFWADHRIFGEIVVPGAAHLAWAISGAIAQNWPNVVVTDIEFVRPLLLGSDDTELQCLVETKSQGQWRVIVASRASDSDRYVEHMRAVLTRDEQPVAPEPIAVAPVSGEWQIESGPEFYKLRIPSALGLGSSFRWVNSVERQGLRARAVLIAPQGLAPEWLRPGPFPGFIDSCFQACMATFDAQNGEVWVPVGVHRVHWNPSSDCSEVNVLVQRYMLSQQGVDEVNADVEVYDPQRRLVARFEGLRARRLKEEQLQAGPGLNYVRAWQPTVAAPSRVRRILLLGGSGALREALLAQSDAELLLTDAGALPTDAQVFVDYVREQIALAEQSDCALAYLEDAEPTRVTSVSWHHDAARATRLIMFAQQLKRQRWQGRAVFLFSRDVAEVNDGAELSRGTPSGALGWGIGPCISRVLRDSPVRVVDVSAQPIPLLAQELGLALRAADDELSAVRGGRLYHARLQRQTRFEPDRKSERVAPEGAWLITGGLSGLGFETAKWLARRGATELVLMGRRSPSEEVMAELAALKAGGTRVGVGCGDVSEMSDLQRVFDNYPQIRHVVHAAGELADRPLEEVTERDVHTCFRAKVGGALNLDWISRSHNVERLVMFASAAGWIGSAGQIAYAAANAKLEDIATARNRRGHPTFIVAFGPFDGVGMAARLPAALRQRQEAAGVSFYSVERGLEALNFALGTRPTSFMALDVNWGRFVQSLVNAQATVPSWVPQDAPAPERSAASKDRRAGALLEQLRQLPASLRLDSLMSTLREQIASVLQLDPQRLDLDAGLFEFGLDSLMAVEIRDNLEQQLAAEFEPTLLIDNSSLRLLGARLLTVCGLDDVAPCEPERDAPISHIATDVHRLSDDQVNGLLEELLGAE